MTVAIAWADVRLVVFDLDGTLYDQPPLRLAMARELGLDCLSRRSTQTLRTLRHFRQVRELLGDGPALKDHGDFAAEQYRLTAELSRRPEREVRALVEEWMERRPLQHLPRFKARGIDRLFAAIRASGRTIAVWSDFPVTAKLAALGLVADHEIWAGDEGVGRLKPDPSGLNAVMARAGATPRETLLIGDRIDRDIRAATAAGTRALLRAQRPHGRAPSFRHYEEPVFAPLLRGFA
ncbi:phosphoglycolate phosphatase/putative hydrolase of the HAD superfamily [Novosphingobium sp. PhB165]|uniref:HAD family hydrolase n=1 Tax=Novosphingobium sp. PhB165 TaxID=2485105 RepID=UPI00104ABEC2|nr:HAD family hydrolase [Novosphingobium sp. PhB165]TCM21652.1 phosphoglycolate phosphatase/putative hydrolase of the HAD superfamily [Novosphingobium sp. PhB165]